MLLQLWRSITPARSSAWIVQSSRFSSFSSRINETSPSEDKNPPQSWYLQLKKEDPDLYRMLRAQNGAITKEFYARLRTKPELFLLLREKQSAVDRKQYATVAKYRAARRERSKAWYEAQKHNDNYHRRNRIYLWLFTVKHSKPWMKDLPWKTHRPVAYTEKVSHYCAGCGYHRLGLKAWVSIPLSQLIKIC